MDTGLSSDYVQALHDASLPYKDKVVHGSFSTMEGYKHAVGVIVGLELAEQVLHDTIKHVIDRQEVDEDKGVNNRDRKSVTDRTSQTYEKLSVEDNDDSTTTLY